MSGISTDLDIELGDSSPYYVWQYVTNGGSSDLNVDADPTSQDFVWTPPDSNIWRVNCLTVYMSQTGTNDEGDFGAISGGLSDGVQIIFDDGTERVMATLKKNFELAQFFEAKTSPTSAGFLDHTDLFYGRTPIFSPSIKLDGNNSDQIIVRIRDDIDALDVFKMGVYAWRDLS